MTYLDRCAERQAERSRTEAVGLPLFGSDFPVRPLAPEVENHALDMPEVSLEARYNRWRASPEGQMIWREIAREASMLVAGGATRLSSKALVETVRARLKFPVNNSHTAFLARDLRELPGLKGMFEVRSRTAL